MVSLSLSFGHYVAHERKYAAHHHLVAAGEARSSTSQSGILPAFDIDVEDENESRKHLFLFVFKATFTYTKARFDLP